MLPHLRVPHLDDPDSRTSKDVFAIRGASLDSCIEMKTLFQGDSSPIWEERGRQKSFSWSDVVAVAMAFWSGETSYTRHSSLRHILLISPFDEGQLQPIRNAPSTAAPTSIFRTASRYPQLEPWWVGVHPILCKSRTNIHFRHGISR
jgi:hypothetical protein